MAKSRDLRRKQASILIKIAKAIAEAGAPAHRLESYMQVLLDKFQLDGCFFAMPTAVLASIGEGDLQRSYMVRTESSDINLSTLQRINEVFNALEADEMDIDDALIKIHEITQHPHDFPVGLMVLSFGLVSGGFATLFAGSWMDTMVAFVLGLITGGISLYGAKMKHVNQLLSPLAAMVAGFLAVTFSVKVHPIDHFLVSLAGLIILVPGLGITLAIRELSTGHLVSGSSRMAGAITTLFLLSFGLALGFLISQNVFGDTNVEKGPVIPEWISYIALVVASLSFTILFKSRVKDTFWIFLSITLAYVGSQLVGLWVEQPFQSLVAVMLVSVMGNLYSRISNNPASLMHIPGIILLVPGSMGFNSLSALYTNDTITGVQAAFEAMLVAVAISIGLLVGNLIIPPKKDL